MLKQGLIHIYCGEGKGKTTAASGLCLRACGEGLRVVIAQFFKDGESGEMRMLREHCGAHYISGYAPGDEFVKSLVTGQTPDISRVKGLFAKAKEEAQRLQADVLLLDEVFWGLHYGALTQEELIDYMRSKPACMELILTGRNPPQEVLDCADYISEIRCVRHPYEKGIGARRGIEY